MRVNPHKYGESILLAVSGGVDSMVMAALFLRELRHGNVPLRRLAVANCNFCLRGQESDGDSALVAAWCRGNGVELFQRSFETEAFAREQGISIEMAARELRYRWFDSLCSEQGFDGVCVAHNANDNTETLLLNMLRGCGIRGLCAMEELGRNPYGDSRVFRPLLGHTRAQIEKWALEHGIKWRTDSTNLLSECKRNVLRNDVFPLLEGINPSFIETFGRNIEHFRQAAAVTDGYVEEALERLGCKPGTDRVELEWEDLEREKHRDYLLYNILSGYGFNSATIGEICALAGDVLDSKDSEHGIGADQRSDEVHGRLNEGGVSGRVFHSPAAIAVSTSKGLVIERTGRAPAEDALAYEALVEVEEISWQSGMNPRTERGCIMVDADALGCYPVFRKWQEGDYLQPIGLKGRKKVSDMLTDLKYNILDKDRALVLVGNPECVGATALAPAGGEHVLALLGERIDASVRITSSTTRVYRIKRR